MFCDKTIMHDDELYSPEDCIGNAHARTLGDATEQEELFSLLFHII